MLRRLPQSEGFRGPQVAAATLLLMYLLQCVWLIRVQTLQASGPDSDLRSGLHSDEAWSVRQGLAQWKGGAIAGTPGSFRSESGAGSPSAGRTGAGRVRDGYDQDRSPLYYLIAAAPPVIRSSWLPESFGPLIAATPYLFVGAMLGASLWYVARRLYGNAGGYIALALYCFSPAMINVAGTQSPGEMGAVWGTFGTVFTAIAVAHTLYAPREVVFWNWRRILLLGLSLALAAGNQFSLGSMALAILPIMLWIAPVRPRAVIVIWIAAIGVTAVLLFAAYFFHPALFWRGMLHARWIDFGFGAFEIWLSYRNVAHVIWAGSPALVLVLPVALITYFGWKRARYFGNTAPLLVAALLAVLALGAPDFPGRGFHLAMLVFLFVFVGGVFADLIEAEHGMLVTAVLCGLLGACAIRNLYELARLS